MARPIQPERKALAGRHLPRVGPAPNAPGDDQRHDEGDQHDVKVRSEHRRGHEDAAVGQREVRTDLDRILDVRQRRENGEIEEQDDQQRRNIAQHLDVDRRNRADQPVGREPRNADDEAENCGDHDGEDRHDDRVDQPGQQHEAVGALGRRRQERHHVEAGAPAEEAEARRDAAVVQVGNGVVGEPAATRPNDDHHQHDLDRDAAQHRVVVPAVPGDIQPSGVGYCHASRNPRLMGRPRRLRSDGPGAYVRPRSRSIRGSGYRTGCHRRSTAHSRRAADQAASSARCYARRCRSSCRPA